jgi:hypothetical protein
LVFLLATLAQADVLSGTVGADGVLVVGEARHELRGDLGETVRGFAGEAVKLEVETRDGKLHVTRIISPVREEVTAVARVKSGAWSLEAAEGRRLAAFGNTAVLEADAEAQTDLWVFSSGRAFVVAVEGKTTKAWTLLKSRVLGGYSVYSGLVRGRGRSVWVLRRDGDQLFLRRGDKTGWVTASDLAVWTPKAGLAGSLPR